MSNMDILDQNITNSLVTVDAANLYMRLKERDAYPYYKAEEAARALDQVLPFVWLTFITNHRGQLGQPWMREVEEFFADRVANMFFPNTRGKVRVK